MSKTIKKYNKGFTLIELAIVVTIITVISLVIVYNHRDFSENVEIKNVAYEVALSARESQVFGLGVKSGDGDYETPYGIHFSTGSSPVNSFTTFIDSNSNGVSSPNETIDTLVIHKNIYVSDISLQSGGSCSSENRASISFRRPDPDAIIRTTPNTNYSSVQVTLTSSLSTDLSKYVIIKSTGQIYVSDEPECS